MDSETSLMGYHERTQQGSIPLDELDSSANQRETTSRSHTSSAAPEHRKPQTPVNTSSLVLWNGMPLYTLVLNFSGIIISLCFFSKHAHDGFVALEHETVYY
jgi:hypothetical protein